MRPSRSTRWFQVRPRHVGAKGGVALLALLAGCGDSSTGAGAITNVDAASPGDAATEIDAGADASDLPDVVADSNDAPSAKGPADDVDGAAAQADDGGPDGPREVPAYPRPTYQHLAETGLFGDPATLTPAADLLRFRPAHPLWSDGAEKDRLVRLPPGTRIDTSDMDHWVLPIGTKLWKEFARGGVKLETRLIERYGPGSEDYWMGSFVWTPDQTDAVFVEEGVANVNGTDHEAPAAKICGSCHRGDRGRVLGVSAIQLSHDDDGAAHAPGVAGGDGKGKSISLADLAAAGWLSDPPPPGVSYPVPGDPDTAAALGCLHGNCGHCHNKSGTSWPDTQVVMRLRVAERSAPDTEALQSLVGKALQYWRNPTIKLRVAAGDPDNSAILARMKARGTRDQMPPLATRHVDPAGIELLTRWITALPH
jgi:hypothetical protein